jgi:hypothetical protein
MGMPDIVPLLDAFEAAMDSKAAPALMTVRSFPVSRGDLLVRP